MTTYADSTLGLSAEAIAILAILADEEACPDKDGEPNPDVWIQTHAWYNGRERGASLTVRADAGERRALIVTFGRHRRSDEIFVDSWQVSSLIVDVPLVDGMMRKQMGQRALFDPGRIDLACRHIRSTIDGFVAAHKVPAKRRRRIHDGASDRYVEKVEMGLLHRIDLDRFYVEDSKDDAKPEPPAPPKSSPRRRK
jgi:hypothetical protein